MRLLLFIPWLLGTIYAMEQPEQCWSSVTYEQATHQYNAAVNLINNYLSKEDLSSCREILDIGCGPGKISFHFAHQVHPMAHIHGIDKSPDMIKKAKEANIFGTRVTFDIFDANSDTLFFKDQFDIVFCSATLHWIKNQENLFKDMVQSTAKNGIILIKTATVSADHPLLQAFIKLKQDIPWKTIFAKTDLMKQFYPLHQETVTQWCNDNELKIESLYAQPNNFSFNDKDELACWFGSWFGGFSAVAKLSQETRTSFIAALVAKYAPYITNKETGRLTHSWPQLILKAIKPYRSSGLDSNHHIIS